MSKKEKTAIVPTRQEDYPQWYQQVIKAADLAENSPVRGCMVIKPWGYALWENMQRALDALFKKAGHKNAYFPLLIPVSYLQKEAEHVDGFAKECAVVTHSRLVSDEKGVLRPVSPLEEPLIIRPTSEMIIGEMFSKWVQSYRDLPLRINQWANVVRWELRTRLFLRTSEFLWQEGHTAHATKQEAEEETLRMLDLYADFAENYMAMPVIKGEKTEGERFPGARNTFSIEAMMQDRKALQSGTSHFLGQNFSKASEIKFLDQKGLLEYAWTTSWGVSTRLVGGLIMTHGDDNGLILPPRLAPVQVVILPIIPKDDLCSTVMEYCLNVKKNIEGLVQVELDDRDVRRGEKRWQWIKKGVPLIVEIGPQEVAQKSVFVTRRDEALFSPKSYDCSSFLGTVEEILQNIQNHLLHRAKQFLSAHTHPIQSKDDFYAFFTPQNEKKPEIHGGFALSHWKEDPTLEHQLKKDLKVTVRCLPLEEKEGGTCIFSGERSTGRAIFAKAY